VDPAYSCFQFSILQEFHRSLTQFLTTSTFGTNSVYRVHQLFIQLADSSTRRSCPHPTAAFRRTVPYPSRSTHAPPTSVNGEATSGGVAVVPLSSLSTLSGNCLYQAAYVILVNRFHTNLQDLRFKFHQTVNDGSPGTVPAPTAGSLLSSNGVSNTYFVNWSINGLLFGNSSDPPGLHDVLSGCPWLTPSWILSVAVSPGQTLPRKFTSPLIRVAEGCGSDSFAYRFQKDRILLHLLAFVIRSSY
jgi:hypothetical protein